jgi:hypothetical protein
VVQSAVKHLINAAWIALLTAGCAGGFTFVVVAGAIMKTEDWLEQRLPHNVS